MKNKVKSLLGMLCVIFSMGVTAANSDNPDRYYQNFFWTSVAASSIDAVTGGVIDDYVGYATATVTFPGSGSYILLDKQCLNDDVLKEPTGDLTYWVQIKDAWQSDSTGIQFKIELDDSRWQLPPSDIILLKGWTTRMSQYRNYTFPGNDNRCWNWGTTTGIVFPGSLNRQLRLKITIPRADAYPGDYILSVPVKWMLEERKYKNYTSPNPIFQRVPEKLNQLGQTSYISIPVSIHSKCQFNTSPINLSHGTMTGLDADGNQTKSYDLNVTCTFGTSLSVKLLGMQKVSGKTDNYTQCGTGGMCELTFNNDKYDETMRIDNSKVLSIKSTYHLNDTTKPVAESFEGSGVLQILVN